MSTQKVTTKVPPPYVFPNSWPLVDLIILCEAINAQLTPLEAEAPVEAQIVDWDQIAAAVKRKLPHRVQEDAATCYVQFRNLATSLMRANGSVFVDAIGTVSKTLYLMRETRIRDLIANIAMSKDRMRIYQADCDFHAGKALDPSLTVNPPPMSILSAQSPIYYASNALVGIHTPPTTAGGNAPAVLFTVVPETQAKDMTYTYANNIVIPEHVDPVKQAVGPRLQLIVPTCASPVDAFLYPRLCNQSVLKAIMEDVYMHNRAGPFLKPVLVEEAPRYLEIISHPMDLGTVRTRLHEGKIANAFELFSLLSLVFTNAYTYNAKNADIWLMARELDFHTSAIFQSTYPNHVDIFVPAVIDAKKGARKPKILKGPTPTVKPVVMPEARNAAALEAALQLINASSSYVKAEPPLLTQELSGTLSAAAPMMQPSGPAAAVSMAAPTPVAAYPAPIPAQSLQPSAAAAYSHADLPMTSHLPMVATGLPVSPLPDQAAPTPTSGRRRKRSPSPGGMEMPGVNINAEPIEGIERSPYGRRASRTPRYDEVEETPTTKRQRSMK